MGAKLTSLLCTLEDLEENRIFLRGSAAGETLRKYERLYKRWVSFREEMVSRGHVDEGTMTVSFIRRETEEGKSASYIKDALAAIQHGRVSRNLPVEHLDTLVVGMARKASGSAVDGRQRSLEREKRERLPAAKEMLQWLREDTWNKGIDERMTYMGVVLGFHFMLRVSEYAHTGSKSADHRFLVEDVYYYDERGGRLGVSDKGIMGITIMKRTGKTNRGGKRLHRLQLSRSSPVEEQLMEDFLRFGRESGTDPKDPFLSRMKLGKRKMLTSSMVNAALKRMALQFGLDPRKFSSHSLRKGGCTSMRVAGVEPETIRRVVGWKPGSDVMDECYALHMGGDRGALREEGPQVSVADVRRFQGGSSDQVGGSSNKPQGILERKKKGGGQSQISGKKY